MTTLQAIVDSVLSACPATGEEIHAPIHTLADGEARHRKKILAHIDAFPPETHPKSMHIGVAGYFNFDVIGKTRPANILLLDANADQTRFWKELFALIAQHENPQEFLNALSSRTVASGFLCEDGTVLQKRFGSNDPALGLQALLNSDTYEHIHEIVASGHAAAATINLVSDTQKAQALGKKLRGDGYSINTAYWSNIGSFFHATRHCVLRSRDDDVFGTEPQQFGSTGLHYKNIGFYKKDAQDPNHWNGYASQEERNAMADEEVPTYERFLENTSALGGRKTLHMHSHASDKIRNIHRFPLILSEGPLRRLPEDVEARKNKRDPKHPDWQERIGDMAGVDEQQKSR